MKEQYVANEQDLTCLGDLRTLPPLKHIDAQRDGASWGGGLGGRDGTKEAAASCLMVSLHLLPSTTAPCNSSSRSDAKSKTGAAGSTASISQSDKTQNSASGLKVEGLEVGVDGLVLHPALLPCMKALEQHAQALSLRSFSQQSQEVPDHMGVRTGVLEEEDESPLLVPLTLPRLLPPDLPSNGVKVWVHHVCAVVNKTCLSSLSPSAAGQQDTHARAAGQAEAGDAQAGAAAHADFEVMLALDRIQVHLVAGGRSDKAVVEEDKGAGSKGGRERGQQGHEDKECDQAQGQLELATLAVFLRRVKEGGSSDPASVRRPEAHTAGGGAAAATAAASSSCASKSLQAETGRHGDFDMCDVAGDRRRDDSRAAGRDSKEGTDPGTGPGAGAGAGVGVGLWLARQHDAPLFSLLDKVAIANIDSLFALLASVVTDFEG